MLNSNLSPGICRLLMHIMHCFVVDLNSLCIVIFITSTSTKRSRQGRNYIKAQQDRMHLEFYLSNHAFILIPCLKQAPWPINHSANEKHRSVVAYTISLEPFDTSILNQAINNMKHVQHMFLRTYTQQSCILLDLLKQHYDV